MLDSFRIMRYHFTSNGTVLNVQRNQKLMDVLWEKVFSVAKYIISNIIH